jgi:hypothetical protein
MASLAVFIYSIYLALYNKSATVGYRFELQLMTADLRLKMYSDVNRLDLISPTQSKSVYPAGSLTFPEKQSSREDIPYRYYRILLTAVGYSSIGFSMKRLYNNTLYIISSQVPSIIYINKPIAYTY